MRADGPQMRVVIVTMDMHLSRVVAQARASLRRDIPGLSLSLHAAAEWEHNPAALEKCKADIAAGDIVICTMIFLEDHIRAVKPALEARRPDCDALVVAMSAPEMVKLTRVGSFAMDKPQKGLLGLIKKLRGTSDAKGMNATSGARQMAMLRRLPKLLRLIPGKAQDVRAYFLTMQYWLAGSDENVANMIRLLVNRYAEGPRKLLRNTVEPLPPAEYPDVGLYHPGLPGRITERTEALPGKANAGTVGLIVLRSYVLAGDTAHYDGVIRELEAKNLRVLPVFACGLDSRPAIDKYFFNAGRPIVDAVISLTGFSLVGGPAYNDSAAAQDILARLDVPYIAAQPVEFQTLERWASSAGGLTPVETMVMVAIPEIDGATAPMIFGGRSDGAGVPCTGCDRHCKFEFQGDVPQMQPCIERAQALAARAAQLITLRRSKRADRKIGIVLFNFPPNAGAAGSAAYLSVFASLQNTLTAMKAEGYTIDLPASVDDLRRRLLEGNATRFGTDANVFTRIDVNDHVRRDKHLAAIEKQWGPAPGKTLTDGRSLFVLGERFGNVFVGMQPGIGIEGDPMRLLFDGSFAPTHAFSAFYRYMREDFGAHALLHFGTHGALEFMPGKQVGLSAQCWPDRLMGALPNYYLYAANNPSEAALAKRRSGATLISYLTPPVAQAGLYKGLAELKSLIDRWSTTASADEERAEVYAMIRQQAEVLELCSADSKWPDASALVESLSARLYEMEQTLIPEGLHILGVPPSPSARSEILLAMADAHEGSHPTRASIEALIQGVSVERAVGMSGLPRDEDSISLFRELETANRHLTTNTEIGAVVHALDAGFIRPAPGGDLLRTPAILPTGRNIHGLDPFRIPSTFAMRDGARQAQRLLDRHAQDGGPLPESIAFVLWGTDNLKSEGAQIGQVLALMGARARFDSYGRLCGAELIPLAELGRPRIDVMTTLSGIFRDLLPLQTRLLAEAAYLAATADEPIELNFVRKHAIALQASLGCDFETAALRVFSNGEGAYGANVNQLIDAGCWDQEDELADAYQSRKCFAYSRTGKATKQPALLASTLKTIDIAYQNLDSLELGITTIDHYVDTLGGISRAVRRAKGEQVAVYVGDQTQGEGKVRTLAEQVTLETRTRILNPRWYDGLLKHGYEGVRQIEAQITNTLGWSATTDQVEPWIYQQISETFVLDEKMRARLMNLNPKASARMANRLLEANDRKYWTPDAATLDALREAGNEMEDRLEGINVMAAE